MRSKVVLFPVVLVLALSATVSTARAVPIPSDPGDFIVDIQPGGPSADEMPECDPELTSIGSLFMAGQVSVTARCSMESTSVSTTVSGSASNPTLASRTGDSGFTDGTIVANCTSSQSVDLRITITTAGATMDSFSGEVFQACAFVMQFADASSSQLFGTIELNGTLGNDDGAVVNNTVSISIEAKVFVTSGKGAFAGFAGSGTFSQSQEINVDPNSRKASVRTFAAFRGNTMSLTLEKSAGVARILAPAPAAGSPKAAAKVTAATKVKVTAPSGSVCVVKANTGRVVGTGKVAGKYSVVAISPRPGSYVGATSIVSTCTTKVGKTLTSNRVKIKL